MKQKTDVLQGTLDLLVLKTLDVMGAMHGYGIAQRIRQISEDVLQLNQGTLYPALLRLEQQGWIQSKWGVSENNRRARYYSVTRSGRRQLAEERASWDRVSGAISAFSKPEPDICPCARSSRGFAAVSQSALDRQLEEEMRFHLDMEAEAIASAA